MIISVANPIYDSVFKFLMEDERIAKTILSALLKEEVLSVEIRRHEHTNTTRDTLSMFRIDFAAKVRDEKGKEKLILIELQKTCNHGKTKSARIQKRNVFSTDKNEM